MTTETMTPDRLIAYLNSIRVGAIDQIEDKLVSARQACEALAQPGLAVELDEAAAALRGADMRTYRKRIEKVVSQLGHLR